MTEQQAEEVVSLLRAATKGGDEDACLYFVAKLTTMDYQPALAAATLGVNFWKFFPAWAEFYESYRRQKELSAPDGEQRAKTPLYPVEAVSKEIPLFVKRWIAARYLYARFGRERDMRPFREEERYLGPQTEWMPEDEWVEEAARVSEKDVWFNLTPATAEDLTF